MTAPDTLEKSIVLACDRARAFELFTREISAWWPPDRRHTGDAESALFLSPERFERARDGREVDLGRVRAWDAPRRIVLDFYVGTDAEHPTEVEIDFADDPNGTRVHVVHRPTAASVELWKQRVDRFERSWSTVLLALAQASSAQA